MSRAVVAPRVGAVSGALLGIGLAIGYEALVLVAAAVGAAALFACFSPVLREGTVRVAVWMALALLAAFVMTTAPSRWVASSCDAMSLNLVLLVGSGAGMMWLLQRFAPGASWRVWIGGMAAGGLLGAGLFAVAEPACLGGPMAMIDGRVKPIWLDHILEVQSLFQYAAGQPKVAFAYFVGGGIAIAILAMAWRRDRTPESLFAVTLMVLAVIYGCIYVRLMPYAVWLTIPVLAVWIAHLPQIGETPARTIRLGAIVLLNQMVLLFAGQALTALAFGLDKAAAEAPKAATSGCEKRAAMRLVGGLPAGLVVADVDLGPHIAAHSSHRVMAAPYHRLDQSIIALHDLLTSRPEAAETRLRKLGATYVVLCAKNSDEFRKQGTGSLHERLRGGLPVAFLEPLALGAAMGDLKAWRVKPATAR